MKTKTLILALCFFLSNLFVSHYLSAQSIYKIITGNSRIIQSGILELGEEVKGYYSMYELDQISKGISKFKLDLLDVNLKLVASTEFNHSNTSNKFDLAFNGEYIMTSNYHTREKLEICMILN